MHRRIAVLLALVSTLVCVPAADAADAVPPDIEMQAPYDVVLTTGAGGKSYIAFSSKVINRGPGVLKVVGERPGLDHTQMDATQILLDDKSIYVGKPYAVLPVGKFEFSPSADHNHWHYLRFEDYNLLKVPSLDLAAPTRKTGFCLLGLDLDFWCGNAMPDLLSIGGPLDYQSTANPDTKAMGMVAEGTGDTHVGPPEDRRQIRSSEDEYIASVEGQDIEITNVPDGRYCLSFEVNPERRVIEDSYRNNSASRLVDLDTDADGDRDIDVVAGTFKGSATCGLTPPVDPDAGGEDPNPSTPPTPGQPSGPNAGPPPSGTPAEPVGPSAGLIAFTRTRGSRLALKAVKKAFTKPRSVTRACGVRTVTKAVCRVSFKQGGARYSGTVTVSQRLRSGAAYWFYSVKVTRTRVGVCKSSKSCPRTVRTKTLMGGALGSNPVAAKRALSAPVVGEAPERSGAAWSDDLLPPDSQTQVRAYRPAGR